MITNDFEQIAPSEDELTHPVRIACTQPPCTSIFPNAGQLQLHLLRHHKINSNNAKSERRFYCPRDTCKYHLSASQHFRSMQLLRQHFLKVHAEKTLICPKCPDRFASKTLLNAHSLHCGNSFRCATCDWKYGSHEALSTHCRRKKHQMPASNSLEIEEDTITKKFKADDSHEINSKTTQTTTSECNEENPSVFLDSWQKRATHSTLVQTQDTNQHLDSPIIDCGTESTVFATKINLNFSGTSFENSNYEENLCHIETQTDQIGSRDGNRLSPMIYTDTHTQTQFDEFIFGLTHIETQTCWSPDFADLLHCAETQTTGKQFAATQTRETNSKTTQTITTQSTLVQTKSDYQLEDCESESNIFATNNSSTQSEINLNHHNFVGTSFENSFPYEDNLCHIETQTDSASLVSNNNEITFADTQTQTQCNEFLFGWTHIETQTGCSGQAPDFDDLLLISTETQTPSRTTMQTQTSNVDDHSSI